MNKLFNPKIFRKRLFAKTAIALLLTSSGLSVQAKTDIKELANELEIMTNILQTSLRQNDKAGAIKTRSIDVTYLANQGVVFDISTTGSTGNHFNFEFYSMHSEPPVPPIPVEGFEQNWAVEFGHDEWNEIAQDAMEDAREAMEDVREKLRNLNDQNRDYGWELRDNERNRRDLEFEMRNADSQRKKEIQNELKELDGKIKSIQVKQNEAQEIASQLQKQQQQKAQEKAKVLNEQYKQFIASFEKNVSTALCKYGAGIKALDLTENISFVLSDFGNRSRNSRQDKIYVFNQQDVQDCVKDKFDANKLLTKAESYSF